MRARRTLVTLLAAALLLAGCQITWPPQDEPPRQRVSKLQGNIDTLEEWSAGDDVLYRDLLPSVPPPRLTGMGSSGYGDTGVTVAFTHRGRQSFLLHVGDVEELPACSTTDDDGMRCIRREPDAPRPFLVYLVAPSRREFAPTTEELVAFWEDAEMIPWPQPPPWGRGGR